MAYQQDFNLDEDKDKKQQDQGTVVASESSASTPSGGSGNGPQNQPKGTSSGSWTNLSNYITANQGNDSEMGNKVKSDIDTQADSATQAGQVYGETANSRIDSGTVRDNGTIDKIKTSPTAITGSADERAKFDTSWNAYYNGPNQANEVEGYQQTGQLYGAVEDSASNAQTYDGRKGLLKSSYARPSYSSGEQSLDSFIMGGGSGGRQAINDIQSNYSNFNNGWGDLVNSVQGNIQAGVDTTNKTREDTRSAVGQGVESYNKTFDDREVLLKEEGERQSREIERTRADLSSPGSARRQRAYAALGLNPEQIAIAESRYHGGSSNNSLITGGQRRGLGDLTSADEAASYAAINELAGNSDLRGLTPTGNLGESFTLNGGVLKNTPKPVAKAEQEKHKTKKPETRPVGSSTMSMPNGNSSGGYGEQTRRKAEKSAVGGVIKKTSPTAKVKKRMGF